MWASLYGCVIGRNNKTEQDNLGGVAESADFRESAPSSAETRKQGRIRKVRSSEFLHTTSGFSENGQKPWIPVWESASHIFAPLAYFTLFSSCGGHLHSNRTSFILPYFHEKEILEYKTNAFLVCMYHHQAIEI